MDFKTAFFRARRGLREDRRLYVVAVSSLTVAFLCLAAALLAITNISEMADRWGRSGRLSVYLRDGAAPVEVGRLQQRLQALPEVREVEHVTAAQARQQFLEQSNVGTELSSLPANAFPPSLEVTLAGETAVQRIDAIAGRVGGLGVVQDVETYHGWFDRLDALLATGKGIAGVLAGLVIVCVLAVIGNTIRLAVAGRRREIEVMKLCGATDEFVRGPFVMEGAFQGLLAALLSIVLLFLGYSMMRGTLESTLAMLTGTEVVFLHPLLMLALVLGGGLVGAAGSALSLRRYLAV